MTVYVAVKSVPQALWYIRICTPEIPRYRLCKWLWRQYITSDCPQGRYWQCCKGTSGFPCCLWIKYRNIRHWRRFRLWYWISGQAVSEKFRHWSWRYRWKRYLVRTYEVKIWNALKIRKPLSISNIQKIRLLLMTIMSIDMLNIIGRKLHKFSNLNLCNSTNNIYKRISLSFWILIL